MIVHAGQGKYVVKSESGKTLSKPESLKAAKKRLAQVEWFRDHNGGKK